MQAVGVLVDAVQNQFVKPWRLKAACAVLKMVGADRAETMPATTAQEVHVRFQEREAELFERQGKLKASEVNHTRSIDVADDCEAAIAAPVPTEAHRTEAGGSGEVVEQATETTQHAASVAVASAAHEPVDDSLDGGGGIREDVIKKFRQSVSDRVSQPDPAAVRPMTIAPGPADRRSRQGESLTRIIERVSEIQSVPIPRNGRRRHKSARLESCPTEGLTGWVGASPCGGEGDRAGP